MHPGHDCLMADAKGYYVSLPTPSGVQRWRLAFRKMRDYGEVSWSKRTIWLRPNQTPAELVDTLIHEAAHVATGFGDGHEPTIEDVLTRVAGAATAVLLRMGLVETEDE